MELEMHLKGNLIDHVRISPKQLDNLAAVQNKLERKHHQEIIQSKSHPKYFICGMPATLVGKKR